MKTYRAKRHDIVRSKQKNNNSECHHPKQKIKQIRNTLTDKDNLNILELFAGYGNLTEIYEKYGQVDCYDKKLGTGDSYLIFHKLISEKKTYDVIDLDPYGFPNRFFPDIFLLIDDGYMFITMPPPYINILNGITQQHLKCYYGDVSPDLETIQRKIIDYGLCHWRDIDFLDITEIGRLWRFVLRVKKVKATEYCGVRNRPEKKTITEVNNQMGLFN